VRELAELLRDCETLSFLAGFALTLRVVVTAERLSVPAESRQDVRRVIRRPRGRDLRRG
jgi:hypothetical protein